MEINPDKTSYQESIKALATALGFYRSDGDSQAYLPQVASWKMIPRGLVLAAADFFDVEVDDATAEQQLAQLVDEAGLLDEAGQSLEFEPGHSSRIAARLAKIIEDRTTATEQLIEKSKPSILTEDVAPATSKSKFVLVNEISALTNSGPETLGPGSKERKSVLENLYAGMEFGTPPSVSKTELADLLAERLGVIGWNQGEPCTSSGQTITRIGLQLLLDAARAQLEQSGTPLAFHTGRSLTVQSEAERYAAAILQTFLNDGVVDKQTYEVTWDGRTAVQKMVDEGCRNARQTEWPGFYFEYRAIEALVSEFKGGPEKVGSTSFDYKGHRLWDLKAHSHEPGKRHGVTPLNDKASIREAVRREGLGFMILSGRPDFAGESDFYEWHVTQVRRKSLQERSPKSRPLKTAFHPHAIDFLFFENEEELNRAEKDGIVTDFHQGKQQSGDPRKVKYNLHLDAALNDKHIHVHHVDISDYFAAV